MKSWKQRLTNDLESVLQEADPRQRISAYHDMPYAIFQYVPDVEFELRKELQLLQTRLEQGGKRITVISLAKCLQSALEAEELDTSMLVQVEKDDLEATIETIHQIISEYQPLDEQVASLIPPDADPLRDIVFIVRTGALFPLYRTSSLLEQLKGKVHIPAVLFYPGELEGAAGLRFMGVLEAEHNYRPKIF